MIEIREKHQGALFRVAALRRNYPGSYSCVLMSWERVLQYRHTVPVYFLMQVLWEFRVWALEKSWRDSELSFCRRTDWNSNPDRFCPPCWINYTVAQSFPALFLTDMTILFNTARPRLQTSYEVHTWMCSPPTQSNELHHQFSLLISCTSAQWTSSGSWKKFHSYNQHSCAVSAIANGLVDIIFTRMPMFCVRSLRYLGAGFSNLRGHDERQAYPSV